jgi:hypothetical protein
MECIVTVQNAISMNAGSFSMPVKQEQPNGSACIINEGGNYERDKLDRIRRGYPKDHDHHYRSDGKNV